MANKEMYMPRDYKLFTKSGCVIQFKANQPTAVPHRAIDEAIAIGAVFVNKEEQKILVDEPPKFEVPAVGFVREQKIFDACAKLINDNDPSDFTPGGKPKLEIIKEAVGFDVDRKEVNAVYAKALEATANAT